MKYRPLSDKNQYYLPKQMYVAAVYYAQQYDIWLTTHEALCDSSKGIDYSKDRVQTNGTGDPTSENAMKAMELKAKLDLIDDIIRNVCKGNEALEPYLLKGVCYAQTYWQLGDIPCGKDLYYKLRQQFYWELSKKI